MSKAKHLPSIAGCAIGFCAAGSGVGSLAGLFLEPWLLPPRSSEPAMPYEQVRALYAGIYYGIAVRMAIGLLVGVFYAVLVRRSRLARIGFGPP